MHFRFEKFLKNVQNSSRRESAVLPHRFSLPCGQKLHACKDIQCDSFGLSVPSIWPSFSFIWMPVALEAALNSPERRSISNICPNLQLGPIYKLHGRNIRLQYQSPDATICRCFTATSGKVSDKLLNRENLELTSTSHQYHHLQDQACDSILSVVGDDLI